MLTVGTGYFAALGVPIVGGRDFTDHDDASSPPVAIVNESFAAKFWPGEQPVGRRLRPVSRDGNGAWHTVIGVVPNIMQAMSGDATRQQFPPLVYVALRQQPMVRPVNNAGQSFTGANLLVRTRVPAAQVAQAVRAELRQLDPDVELEYFDTLKANSAFDRDRMVLVHAELGKQAAVAPAFGGIALLLAGLGLYAIVAHSVAQRTKEISVQMAIGASKADVRRMVLRDGMVPVAIGALVGIVASFAINRLLSAPLVGVSPYDATTLALAPIVMCLVSLLACYVPARRAIAVDPAVTLLQE